MKNIFSKPHWIGYSVTALLLVGGLTVAAVTLDKDGRSSRIADHRPEMAVSGQRMMKSAPMAGFAEDMISLSAAPQESARRVEETHSFRFKVDRESVADQYERAFKACSSPSCEVMNGNLNVQGVTKSASLTVRIEPDSFNDYMEVVGDKNAGVTLVNHSRSATDRTRQYQDIEARMKSQTRLRDRLINMVDSYHGQNIRSLLEIERELARVQGQIESMEAQLRDISARTDRLTASVNFFSDHLEVTPEHPPYLKNALKEVGVIFESQTARVVRFIAAFSPYLIAIIALFLTWKALTFWRKPKIRK